LVKFRHKSDAQANVAGGVARGSLVLISSDAANLSPQLQSWQAAQPVLQQIFNLNLDGTIRDAWVVGARLEVAF